VGAHPSPREALALLRLCHLPEYILQEMVQQLPEAVATPQAVEPK